MARTRGLSNVIHADDGELLDKEGKPIDPSGKTLAPIYPDQPPAYSPAPLPVEPPPPAPARYASNNTTWHRNMDAVDALLLMDLFLGGLSIEVDEEAFRKLNPNVKQHFRRVG